MRDMSEFEDRSLRREKPKPSEPLRSPIALKSIVSCSRCQKDFEWVGLAKDIEALKTCSECLKKVYTW